MYRAGQGQGETPLVSVILPTYDRPERLADAVESVATQRYGQIELIVVDDASPSPVEPVVAAAAPPSLQWRVVHHDQNRGANAARNTGIDAANGELLTFLDDDDEWLPDKLDSQLSAFRDGGDDVGVVLVGQQFVKDGEETVVRCPDVGSNATRGLLTDGVGGSFSTLAVRRSVVKAAGRPDERLPAWQDREWLVRLSRHCEFATVQRPLIIRRIGDYDQISDLFEPKRDITYPVFLERYSDLAAEYGVERRFKACLAQHLSRAALITGYYCDARRFAAKAIRLDPSLISAYVDLGLSFGGNYTYDAAARVKHVFD